MSDHEAMAIHTAGGGGPLYFPSGSSGVILVDETGNEARYSPEEWRHKKLAEKLTAIDEKLDRLMSVLERIADHFASNGDS